MRTEEKYKRCVESLRLFVDDTGYSDVVVGLSGGIDSAVTAVMCVDAFGEERVHGVLLPGPYSSGHSVTDARQLADNLKIPYDEVSILEPFEAFDKVLEKSCGGKLKGLASENAQARCRMVCLMALCNTYNWLLINTGNKTEAMMGYSTLYGDMAGAFAPLGGIYKTDVFKVAHWRNEKSEREGKGLIIPQSTLEKPPSAELSPNQEDEKSLGIDYDRLDKMLIEYVELRRLPEDLLAAGYPETKVIDIISQVKFSEFKRAYDPPFPADFFYL